MKVSFNNRELELAEGTTLHAVLRKIGYRRVMVTYNGKQIPAYQFKETVLSEGDEIITRRVSAGCC